jgi:hypothetical protein
MIFFDVAGPTPGSASSSFSEALFKSTRAFLVCPKVAGTFMTDTVVTTNPTKINQTKRDEIFFIDLSIRILLSFGS